MPCSGRFAWTCAEAASLTGAADLFHFQPSMSYQGNPSVAAPSSQQGLSPIEIIPIAGSLDSVFTIETALASHDGHRSYGAREISASRHVKLNLAADLEQSDSRDVDARARQLCLLAAMSRLPDFPPALLPVYEVLRPSDFLACTEEFPPAQTLAELLRARKSPMRFNEAIAVLRPVAQALDFMLVHGLHAVFLRCGDISLAEGPESEASPLPIARMLTDCESLQVRFSMICLPLPAEDDTGGSNMEATMMSGAGMGRNLEPVRSFSRLVYRIVNGSEAPEAAEITPAAYNNTVNLSAASNIVLRDIFCGQRSYPTVSAVLKELCAYEGIAWKDFSAGNGSAATAALSRQSSFSAAAVSTPPEPVARPPIPPAPVKREPPPSAPPPLPRPVSAAPPPLPQRPPVSVFERDSSADETRPADATASTVGPATRSYAASEKEKVCDVLGPGIVESPYDPARNEMSVPPERWIPNGRLQCAVTGKSFRLPAKLVPLVARVLAPGKIQSPYCATPQRVAWEDWVPGRKVLCCDSAKPLTLPPLLPLPEGILIEGEPGTVASPYKPGDPKGRVRVEEALWTPEGQVLCPITEWPFVLPSALPPYPRPIAVVVPPEPEPQLPPEDLPPPPLPAPARDNPPENPPPSFSPTPPPVEQPESPIAPSAPEEPVAPLPRVDEDVRFTVYRPAKIRRGEWYSVVAFAHLAAPSTDSAPGEIPLPVAVEKEAARILGETISDCLTVSQDCAQAVAREQSLSFVLTVPGAEVNPPLRSFRWTESMHREEFRVRVPVTATEKTLRGKLALRDGDATLAEAVVALPIDAIPK